MKVAADKSKFQWNARDYANHSGVQQQWARELLAGLDLQGNESLLDIGCGDGKVTAEIASCLKSGKVVGIDSSEEMISLAASVFPATLFPNLLFIKQDARKLSFCREFDVVFSNAALHWVLDHRPVLKGIYQALKPGGRLIVQMGGKGNATGVITVVNDIMRRDEWQKYFADFSFPYGFYSPAEYKPWLQQAGFEIISLELKAKDMMHETEEQFKGWFRTTWLPYLERIPAGQQEHFINTVTEKYLQHNPPDQEGKIYTKMQRLEYVVTK